MKPKVSEHIECTIHDLGKNGEGVGSYNQFTIFVHGALPKETVRVEVFLVKKNYAVAKLIEVLIPSQDRIKPPCPYFERCGGCQIMHLDYPSQLEVKQKRIQDAFQRIGKIHLDKDVMVRASPDIFEYRNKIQLPAGLFQNQCKLGLYAKGSHEIVFHDQCLIHTKIGEKIYQSVLHLLEKSNIKPYDEKTKKGELRHVLIRSSIFNHEALLTFITKNEPSQELAKLAKEIFEMHPELKGVLHHKNAKNTNFVFDKDFTLLAGIGSIEEKLDDLIFTLSPASFFQINTKQALLLYHRAIELSGVTKDSVVLDAYCGIGTLSLILAKYVNKVIGIECVNSAILDANQNKKNNQIENATFICAKVEDAIHDVGKIDAVFLNPPRKGCDPRVIEAICRSKPRNLVYISCDPATLARDANLLRTGGYEVESVEGFDMFPQTMHVETLAKFACKLS